MPWKLMAIQRHIARLLPEKLVAPPGLSKEKLLHVLDMISDVAHIRAPTLIVSGAKDCVNLSASRRVAQQIPGAQLGIINGAGYQCHIQQLKKFAAVLYRFLTRSLGH